MADEYAFKQKECYCGADLKDVKAEVSSNRYDIFPQGKCPECGRELLLDTDPVAPSMESPEAIMAAVEKKRSRKSKD